MNPNMSLDQMIQEALTVLHKIEEPTTTEGFFYDDQHESKHAVGEVECLLKNELGKKLELEFAKPQHEIQHLPNETLLHICQFLSHKDLNNISLVSRRFYDVATIPNLWKNTHYSISSMKDRIDLMWMLGLPRFRKESSIKLSGSGIRADFQERYQLYNLMKEITGSKLKHLTFDHMDFKEINSIANVINSLESFSAEFCVFNQRQVARIFSQMSEEYSKLKSLKLLSSINEDYIKQVRPLIFARGVNKLESLDLGSSDNDFHGLTKGHLLKMFAQMSVETNLKRLHLGPVAISYPNLVPSETLAKAISKLEEFIAPRIEFSAAQIQCVLIAVSKDSSKIRKLDLGSNFGPRFINVDIGILTKVMNKIEMNDFKLLMTMRSIEFRNQQVLTAEVVYADMVENRKRKLMEDESVEVLKNMPKEKRMKKMIRRRLQHAFSAVQRAVGIHSYSDVTVERVVIGTKKKKAINKASVRELTKSKALKARERMRAMKQRNESKFKKKTLSKKDKHTRKIKGKEEAG